MKQHLDLMTGRPDRKLLLLLLMPKPRLKLKLMLMLMLFQVRVHVHDQMVQLVCLLLIVGLTGAPRKEWFLNTSNRRVPLHNSMGGIGSQVQRLCSLPLAHCIAKCSN